MNATLKKALTMLLVVALTASIAITGTLAYLTDRDSEANVFTVGNVEIDLEEDFQQGAELIPGVKIEKEASITNTGKNDAWVWMTLAVPTALDDAVTELGVGNVLHWNYPGCVSDAYYQNQNFINSGISNGVIDEALTFEETWNIDDKVAVQTNVEIEGVQYNVYTFLYNGVLAAGDETVIALQQMYLDTSVDIDPNGDWYSVKDGVTAKINWNSNTNGNPVVYVSAYAMQTEGFATVQEAYAAYQTQWGENGTEYGTPAAMVSSGEELVDTLNNGGTAVMTDNITIDADTSAATSAYGDTGIAVNGGTIDGAGNTLTVTNSNETWDSAVYAQGGTIKNLTINGAFRGIFIPGLNEDLYIDNVTIDDVCYTISADGSNPNYSVVVTDSTINGWTSYTGGFKSVSFTNCNFGAGTGGYTYAYCRPYSDTSFTNCVFATGYELDATEATVTLVNCYVGNTLITADNVAALLGVDAASAVIG